MSIQATLSKPSPISPVTSSETKLEKPALGAAAQGEKPLVPADKPAAAATQTTAVQLLLKDLTSADSARRATAAEVLGRIEDAAVVPALIAALGDTDADVAREAAGSLGLQGNVAAVEPLIAVLNDRDGYFHGVVRTAACRSLGQLHDVRAVEPLLNAVKDSIAEASAEAIGALASLSDPRIVPALLEVVRNEHGFFLATARRAAVTGLGRIGGAQAACELRFVAANQWEDEVIRTAAVEAICKDSTVAGRV